MISIAQCSRIIGISLLATTLVVALVAVLVLSVDLVMILGLALLFGVFLTKASQWLGHYIPLSYAWNLALVVTLLLVLAGSTIAIFGVKIESRLSQTSQRLDEGATQLRQWVDQHPIAMTAVKRVPFVKDLVQNETHSEGSDRGSDERSPAEDGARGEPTNSATESGGKKNSNSSQSQETDASSDRTSQEKGKQQNTSSRFLQSAAGKVFSVFSRIFFTTLGLVTNVGVVFFVGVFLAVNPRLYRDGFVKLFPLDRRGRTREIMNQMGDSLYSWLMGRFMTMAITGAGTALALWALGVPMPVTIGVVTGLLTFVPNIGGLIALGLAVLMAMPQGPAIVGWVVALYALLQLVESNIITPLLQQQQTSIPPALLISFQILMGALTGFLGLMVATPMLAASMVLVKEAWIKDSLGDHSVDE